MFLRYGTIKENAIFIITGFLTSGSKTIFIEGHYPGGWNFHVLYKGLTTTTVKIWWWGHLKFLSYSAIEENAIFIIKGFQTFGSKTSMIPTLGVEIFRVIYLWCTTATVKIWWIFRTPFILMGLKHRTRKHPGGWNIQGYILMVYRYHCGKWWSSHLLFLRSLLIKHDIFI